MEPPRNPMPELNELPRLAPPSPVNGNRLPPGPGRPKGSPNKASLYIQKFCRGILESEEYIASVKRRIVADTLPPQIEALYHHYAYGKPKDTIEIITPQADLAGMSADELAHEAQETARAILAYKQQEQDAALEALPVTVQGPQ